MQCVIFEFLSERDKKCFLENSSMISEDCYKLIALLVNWHKFQGTLRAVGVNYKKPCSKYLNFRFDMKNFRFGCQKNEKVG